MEQIRPMAGGVGRKAFIFPCSLVGLWPWSTPGLPVFACEKPTSGSTAPWYLGQSCAPGTAPPFLRS